jgi:hypothetical protein
MPNAGKCAGEEFAAISGCVILSSYLVLFIGFYFATYKKPSQKGRKRRDTATKATIDMAKMEIPTVDNLSHGHLVGNANGEVKVNGNANASGRSANGKSTRSRKA